MKYLVITIIVFCLLPQIFSLRHPLHSNEDRGRSAGVHGNSNNIIYAEGDDGDDDDELDEGNIISLYKAMVNVLKKKHLVEVDEDLNSFTKKGLSSNTNINNIGKARERKIVAFKQLPIAYVPVFHDKLNGFEHIESETEYISPKDQQHGRIYFPSSFAETGNYQNNFIAHVIGNIVNTVVLSDGELAYLIRANNKNHFNNNAIANGEGLYTVSSNVKPNLVSSFWVDDNNNFVLKTHQQSPNQINQAVDTSSTHDNEITINEFDEQWELEKYPEQNDNDNMPHAPIPSPGNKNRHSGIYNNGKMFGRRSMTYDTNYNTANMRNVNP